MAKQADSKIEYPVLNLKVSLSLIQHSFHQLTLLSRLFYSSSDKLEAYSTPWKLVPLPTPTILSTTSSLSTSYMSMYVWVFVCFNFGCTMLSVCLVAICPISWRGSVGVERAPQSTPYRAIGLRLRWPDCSPRDRRHKPISLMKCNNCQVYLVTRSCQGLSHRLSLSGGLP